MTSEIELDDDTAQEPEGNHHRTPGPCVAGVVADVHRIGGHRCDQDVDKDARAGVTKDQIDTVGESAEHEGIGDVDAEYPPKKRVEFDHRRGRRLTFRFHCRIPPADDRSKGGNG